MIKIDNIDLKHLSLVGEGYHGKVYRLDENLCVKICKEINDMQMEYRVLKYVKNYPQFPKVYGCKGRYMVREYIDGQNIIDYIKKYGFDNELAKELTELIEVFVKLKFARIDIRMHEVFVTKDHKIRIVDTTRYLDQKSSYPRKMLKTLKKLKCNKKYMSFIKENYPEMYKLCNNH